MQAPPPEGFKPHHMGLGRPQPDGKMTTTTASPSPRSSTFFTYTFSRHHLSTIAMNAILHGQNSTSQPEWHPNPITRGTWGIYQTCIIGELKITHNVFVLY